MSLNIVTAVIDRDKNFIIQGRYEWQRDATLQEGILIPPSGTSFPAAPDGGEIFWRTDQSQLYRRNDGNTAWEAVTGAGDVSGPASSTDNALVRFDGTSGKSIQQAMSNPPTMDDNGRIQGTYTYAPSASDPAANPTPAAGDRYFNTAIQQWMQYDGDRSKWLSVDTFSVQMGRNGTVASPGALRGINGLSLGSGRGIPVPKSTLIYVGIARTDSDASQIAIGLNDSTIHTVSTSAMFVEETNTNVDVSGGRLQGGVPSGQNSIDNCQVLLLLKRRA